MPGFVAFLVMLLLLVNPLFVVYASEIPEEEPSEAEETQDVGVEEELVAEEQSSEEESVGTEETEGNDSEASNHETTSEEETQEVETNEEAEEIIQEEETEDAESTEDEEVVDESQETTDTSHEGTSDTDTDESQQEEIQEDVREEETTTQEEEEDTSPADTEPPVIEIKGNNPARIPVGSTYSDLGASVSDNINFNLGYSTRLNGESVSKIEIDTSTPNSYVVMYVATDAAGNSSHAERIVEIFDPNEEVPEDEESVEESEQDDTGSSSEEESTEEEPSETESDEQVEDESEDGEGDTGNEGSASTSTATTTDDQISDEGDDQTPQETDEDSETTVEEQSSTSTATSTEEEISEEESINEEDQENQGTDANQEQQDSEGENGGSEDSESGSENDSQNIEIVPEEGVEENELSTTTSTSTDEEIVDEGDVNDEGEEAVNIAVNPQSKYIFAEGECTFVNDGEFYCIQQDKSAAASAASEGQVFAEVDVDGDKEIFMLRDGEKIRITNNDYDDDVPILDDSGKFVVWHALINDRYQIMAYDIEAGRTVQVTDETYNSTNPGIYGTAVVWQGWAGANWDIFYVDDVFDEGAEVKQLTTNDYHDMFPQIYNNLVTWQASINGSWRVFVYDTVSGSINQVEKQGDGRYENPRFVLLFDNRESNGDVDVVGYDVDTGDIVPIKPVTPNRQIPESPTEDTEDAIPTTTSNTGQTVREEGSEE